MKGEQIKEILNKEKVTQADMARYLKMSPQNFNSKIRSEDVASSFVEDIANALEKPIGWMYGEVTDEEVYDKTMIPISVYDRKVEECYELKLQIKLLEAKK